MIHLQHASRAIALAFVALLVPTAGLAQELQPQRWSHLPLATNFVGGGYVATRADVLFDPVLQLEDVELEMDSYALSYIRSFRVAGRSARIDVAGAYQKGRWEGLLEGAPASTERSGWADPIVRFAVTLHGAPPLRGKEFAEYRGRTKKETIVGTAVAVHLPLGDYTKNKLINLGTNRFTIRPQLGVVHTRGKWSFEFTGSIWFFTDNNDFWQNTRLEQDPLFALQGHVVYEFRPGLTLAAGYAYGIGAEMSIDGTQKSSRQGNAVWSVKARYPFSRRFGIALTYLGWRTRVTLGQDADSLALTAATFW